MFRQGSLALGLNTSMPVLQLQSHTSEPLCKRTYTLQGQWIRGIIDQLELDESGQIRVVENKTRRKPSLPMLAQQETAKLQVRITHAAMFQFGAWLMHPELTSWIKQILFQ